MAAATAGLRAHWRCVDTIWQLATATPRLTDEVFCQLVKHTTLNGNRCGRGASCGRPTNSGSDGRVRVLGFRKYGGEGGGDGTAARGHSESALAGWKLLTILSGTLVPSSALLPYVAAHVARRGPDGYASYCLRLLRRGAFTTERRRRYAVLSR